MQFGKRLGYGSYPILALALLLAPVALKAQDTTNPQQTQPQTQQNDQGRHDRPERGQRKMSSRIKRRAPQRI